MVMRPSEYNRITTYSCAASLRPPEMNPTKETKGRKFSKAKAKDRDNEVLEGDEKSIMK